MKILDKEEEEHITQVCQAFSVKQDKLSIEKPTTKNLLTRRLCMLELATVLLNSEVAKTKFKYCYKKLVLVTLKRFSLIRASLIICFIK